MAPQLSVQVQAEDFDIAGLQKSLLAGAQEEGAIATFTGYVRADAAGGRLQSMELEHYPGMTERSILDILEESADRWPLLAARVVHRIGELRPGDNIVWVGVASAHRAAAFEACEFIMDYLKTRAPFWKREVRQGGVSWVDARSSDQQRADRWKQKPEDQSV